MKTLQKSYAFSFPFCSRIPHTVLSIYIYRPWTRGSTAITWTRQKGFEKSALVFFSSQIFKLSADLVDQPHDLNKLKMTVICEKQFMITFNSWFYSLRHTKQVFCALQKGCQLTVNTYSKLISFYLYFYT